MHTAPYSVNLIMHVPQLSDDSLIMISLTLRRTWQSLWQKTWDEISLKKIAGSVCEPYTFYVTSCRELLEGGPPLVSVPCNLLSLVPFTFYEELAQSLTHPPTHSLTALRPTRPLTQPVTHTPTQPYPRSLIWENEKLVPDASLDMVGKVRR